jgi:hypothetical protein
MPFSAGALRMLGADIPFHDLAMRHPGLTPEIGECYTQAVRVCLDRHHTPPIDVRYDHLRNGSLAEAVARWESTTNQERNAWANDIDTTEQGAYGFALAIVDLAEGMIAVRRAETGTGADYYIAAPGQAADDLENCLRLEVSGVDRGDEQTIRQRLRQKVQQARDGNSSLPAIAAVVGFRERLVALARAD